VPLILFGYKTISVLFDLFCATFHAQNKPTRRSLTVQLTIYLILS